MQTLIFQVAWARRVGSPRRPVTERPRSSAPASIRSGFRVAGRCPSLPHDADRRRAVRTLTPEECEAIVGALLELRAEVAQGRSAGDVETHEHGAYFLGLAHFHATHPALTAYLTKPELVGVAEELCGGTVRLNSCYAIFNRRPPMGEVAPTARFHVSVQPPWGTWTANGLFHSCMVRLMTNLTDVGPDDGGTLFVAGSHKLNVSLEDVVACADSDPSLVHQVAAPAGTTVVFSESTVHATGPIRSDRERVVISGVYTPTMYRGWDGIEPSDDAVSAIPASLRPFVTGNMGWRWTNRYRTLGARIRSSNIGSAAARADFQEPRRKP